MTKTEDGRQAVVMIVGVGKPFVDKPNQLVVNAPISARLPAGIKMQDKSEKTLLALSYTFCKPSMCSADTAVTDAQLNTVMAAGDDVFMLYRTQAGQDVKVQVPMKGMSAAYKAMQKEAAAR